MIDKEELEYFKKEYPEFDEEEIVEILEALALSVGNDGNNFNDYLNKDKPQASGLAKSFKKILDIDD